jgi:hypothetical protein
MPRRALFGEQEKEAVEAPSLGFWTLVGASFVYVNGGPYSLEPLVSAEGKTTQRTFVMLFPFSLSPPLSPPEIDTHYVLGPGWALAGQLLVPLVWCLPQILLASELTCMVGLTGGGVVWVQRAFGDRVAFMYCWNTVRHYLHRYDYNHN